MYLVSVTFKARRMFRIGNFPYRERATKASCPIFLSTLQELPANYNLMHASDIIGSAGVALLLIAYLMNLFKWVGQESKAYSILNVAGAGLACCASLMIAFIPFVVLEGIWAIVALIGMFRKKDRA